MRAGGFTIQQALTPDAATIIKQAVTLARRRGHAQVTPLHVAHTMLSASPGLLRTACLQSQSHSHPLQCKALELCFNVALNRLPASSTVGPPMLGPQNNSYSTHPSISNALVAAFKRAQAHQRRGSIESQQQPLLAVKIELEQLIISILDDPSVSRVMREAGFSSTLVKSNVEQAQAQSSSSTKCKAGGTNLQIDSKIEAKNEDVMRVIENLVGKKRKNLVIVGECLDTIEGVVRGVMSNEVLREVKFIRIPLSSLGQLSRSEREQELGKLKCLMQGSHEKGFVLYLGDLEWVIENRAASGGSGQGQSYNSPVEEMIHELGKLACGGEGGDRGRNIWILGIASFKTYMRCRNGYPSLESVLGLHAITVPAGSLGLSLIPESDVQSDTQSKKDGNGSTSWLFHDHHQEKHLTCCVDCSAKFNTEARTTTTFSGNSSSSSLPLWLKNENKRLNSNNDQDCVSVKELCKKWNSFCSSTHKQTLTFASMSPSSSTSCFSFDHQNPNSTWTHQNWPVFEPKSSCRDHKLWSSITTDKQPCETSLRMYIALDNPNSTPNSASSSDIMETEYIQRFKEFNAENLKTLCSALEKRVPWHKDIVPEIAGTVLQCRSGMLRRREKIQCSDNIQAKEETWLVFQGVDAQAKEKIARELAKAVFGSHSSFVLIALSTFSSSTTRADSTEDLRNYKRSRDEKGCSYIERLGEEVLVNPHRVFFVEDVEQADYCSQMGIKRAIERGIIVKSNGEEVSLSDAIVILSCESFSSRSRACSPPIKQRLDIEGGKGCVLMEETNANCVPLDLNIMCFDDGDGDGDGGGDEEEEDQSIDDIGLLECVDRRIIFKIQEL